MNNADTVSTATAGPATTGLPLYALIDPYFREPGMVEVSAGEARSLEELCSARTKAWGRPVFVAESEKPLIDPLRLPYFVALDGTDDPLFAELVSYAQQEAGVALEEDHGIFSIGALVESAAAPTTLMQRVEAMWCVRVAFGRERYLRLADPRVFEMLFHLLPAEEMRCWLGPIAKWHVRTRSCGWTAVSGAADEALIDNDDDLYNRRRWLARAQALSAKLNVDHERQRHLERSAWLSQALTEIQRQGAPCGASAHAAAWQAIDEAEAKRLKHPDDIVVYTWHRVMQPHFGHSSVVANEIEAACADPGSLELRLLDLQARSTGGREEHTP